MRDARTLEAMVVGLKPWAPALYSIVAVDDAEESWFTDRLKGHQGVKHISIVRRPLEDLTPIMDRVRGPWPNETPAAKVKVDPKPTPALTEDGY